MNVTNCHQGQPLLTRGAAKRIFSLFMPLKSRSAGQVDSGYVGKEVDLRISIPLSEIKLRACVIESLNIGLYSCRSISSKMFTFFALTAMLNAQKISIYSHHSKWRTRFKSRKCSLPIRPNGFPRALWSLGRIQNDKTWLSLHSALSNLIKRPEE